MPPRLVTTTPLRSAWKPRLCGIAAAQGDGVCAQLGVPPAESDQTLPSLAATNRLNCAPSGLAIEFSVSAFGKAGLASPHTFHPPARSDDTEIFPAAPPEAKTLVADGLSDRPKYPALGSVGGVPTTAHEFPSAAVVRRRTPAPPFLPAQMPFASVWGNITARYVSVP